MLCLIFWVFWVLGIAPVVPLAHLEARGQGRAARGNQLNQSAEQEAERALQEVEQQAASYPKLRVFVSFQRPVNRRSQDEVTSIWSEPSLYEALLWFDNFNLLTSLNLADRQMLGQNLMQILSSTGDLTNSPEGELGRIFIKNYFRRTAGNPYSGQGSWLVFRIFLDPINPEDRGARRLSILYNAHWEVAAQTAESRTVEPLFPYSDRSPIQRSSVYPQKSNTKLSYQYAYLIPEKSQRTEPRREPRKGPVLGSAANTGPKSKENPSASPDLTELDKELAPAKPQNVRYHLSFIGQPELHAQHVLHPQYSMAKYLSIVRNYLRDGQSANDSLVPPAINELNRREMTADDYFLIQEIILYYYLLYLPDRSSYFISSQQNQWQFKDASSEVKNLWRVQIPYIWAVIDILRLRYSQEFNKLLPG